MIPEGVATLIGTVLTCGFFWWLKQDLAVSYSGVAVGHEHELKKDIREIRKELKALIDKMK